VDDSSSREEYLVDMPISDFCEMCSAAKVVDLQAFGSTLELAKRAMIELMASCSKELQDKTDYLLMKETFRKMLEIQSIVTVIVQKQSICKHWEYVKMPDCFKN
jgi:hypothetical protein